MAILQRPEDAIAMQLRFFAAQTMKHKIVSDFVQLDAVMTASLKAVLWRLTIESPANQRAVAAQLELAVAALIVQCPAPLWPSPIADLLQQPNAAVAAQLSVLAAIPEQLCNPLIHQNTTEHATQQRRLLENNVDQVVDMVGNMLHLDNHTDRTALVGCLLSWIKYGAAGPAVVGSSQLLGMALQTLTDDLRVRSDSAALSCDLICELFFRFFQLADVPSSAYLNTLMEGLARLWPVLVQLIQEQVEETDDLAAEAEDPFFLGVGRVFLEAGEAFIPFLLGDDASMVIIIEAALLMAEQKASLRAVEATFSFWSALENRLSSFNEESRARFIPPFARLFRSLTLNHLAFPLQDSAMSAEARDAFREFRHVIGDCLKDCVGVMGSTEALQIVSQLLHETNGAPWQHIEAVLFSLRTISSSVDRRESEMMPNIANSLLQIATISLHPKLVYAVILNVGCYADWLFYHSDYLAPFLSLIAANIVDHSAAASMALKYVCQSCGSLLTAHEPTLRSLYTQAISSVSSQDAQELTEAMANVLVRIPGRLEELLPVYVMPWTSTLGGSLLDQDRVADAFDNCAIYMEIINGSLVMNSLIEQVLSSLPALIPKISAIATLESLVACLKVIASHHPQFIDPVVDLLDVLFVQRGIPEAIYVLRYVAMADPSVLSWPRLRQSLLAALPVVESTMVGMAEFLQFSKSLVDYYMEAMSEQAMGRVVHLAKLVIEADPPTPSDLSQALLFLIHLLARAGQFELHKHSSFPALAGIPACIHSVLQALPRFPAACISDLAALLRRSHLYDPPQSLSCFQALLAALPNLLPRERETWLEKYRFAVESPRPRDVKEFLIAFTATLKRRLD